MIFAELRSTFFLRISSGEKVPLDSLGVQRLNHFRLIKIFWCNSKQHQPKHQQTTTLYECNERLRKGEKYRANDTGGGGAGGSSAGGKKGGGGGAVKDPLWEQKRKEVEAKVRTYLTRTQAINSYGTETLTGICYLGSGSEEASRA